MMGINETSPGGFGMRPGLFEIYKQRARAGANTLFVSMGIITEIFTVYNGMGKLVK